MSAFRDMVIDIQNDIEAGELTFDQIAVKYDVSVKEVEQLAWDLAEEFSQSDEYFPDPDSWYENQYDIEDF